MNQPQPSSTPTPRGARAGFTLLEVMVSAAILAFAIGSTLAVLSHTATYIADLRLRAESEHVLQQQVESLRLLPWVDVPAAPATFTVNSENSDTQFHGRLRLASFEAPNGTTTVWRATVSVNWTNRHNRLVGNQTATLVARGGLNQKAPAP